VQSVSTRDKVPTAEEHEVGDKAQARIELASRAVCGHGQTQQDGRSLATRLTEELSLAS